MKTPRELVVDALIKFMMEQLDIISKSIEYAKCSDNYIASFNKSIQSLQSVNSNVPGASTEQMKMISDLKNEYIELFCKHSK